MATHCRDRCEIRFVPERTAAFPALDPEDLSRATEGMTPEAAAAAFGPGVEEDSLDCSHRIYLRKGCPGECYWFWFKPEKGASPKRVLSLIVLQASSASNDVIVWPKERAGEKPASYLEMIRLVAR